MTKQQGNFLEVDSSIIDKKLTFVKNDLEEEINSLFQPLMNENDPNAPHKLISTTPGLCIKGVHKETREKVFINVTTTDQIPAPEITDEDRLIEVFNSGMSNEIKVPMSLAAPALTKDNSGKFVKVIDVAINTMFFRKMEKSDFLKEFLFTIFLEGINDKYKIPIDEGKLVVLQNRKSIGELKQHYIQNRDVKKVYDTFKNPSEEDKKNMENINRSLDRTSPKPERKLIEISSSSKSDSQNKRSIENVRINDTTSSASMSTGSIPRSSSFPVSYITPYYKLIREPAEGLASKIYAIFSLPQCVSANEIILTVGEDRIVLEVRTRGYLLDEFIDYKIDQENTKAQFNLETKILKLVLPIIN